jgi:hypothetical protein
MRQDIQLAKVEPPVPPSIRLKFAANASKDLLVVNCAGLTPLIFRTLVIRFHALLRYRASAQVHVDPL